MHISCIIFLVLILERGISLFVVRNRPVSRYLHAAVKGKQVPTKEQAPSETLLQAKPLTQKEYLIAIRNRLFLVEEQIWLHEYASSRRSPNIEPLTPSAFEELKLKRQQLLAEYPLTQLQEDLRDAQGRNMTYAAMYLERLSNSFRRQLPVRLDHVNQIAVLSSSGQVINLMRGQGAVSHRLLPSAVPMDASTKRQFQHPVFSPSGRYVAFAEMHFRPGAAAAGGSQGGRRGAGSALLKGQSGSEGGKTASDEKEAKPGFVRSEAVVFEVPRDPTKYGASDSMPLYHSGDLPGAPFFLQFSPGERQLVMLCADPGGSSATSLVELSWSENYRAGHGGASRSVAPKVGRYSSRNVRTLLQGTPLFFTHTTSDSKNATLVVHCQREPLAFTATGRTDEAAEKRAVWMLERSDGIADAPAQPQWTKISEGDPYTQWSTPICHSAGGGDNVLLVEDGWLVTRALSRWKRGADGALQSKRLRPVKGQVQFLVSPDSSKAVVLEEDAAAGYYALTAIEGEDALDPARPAAQGRQFELPLDRLTLAFWFSPDSTKLLCLTAAGKSREDISSTPAKSAARVGVSSEMQWAVYNFPLQEVREYEPFRPTPYFMKTYVPFFTQYAQAYNPWAPDSASFLHMTSAGLAHTPLVEGRPCLGADRWQNQGNLWDLVKKLTAEQGMKKAKQDG